MTTQQELNVKSARRKKEEALMQFTDDICKATKFHYKDTQPSGGGRELKLGDNVYVVNHARSMWWIEHNKEIEFSGTREECFAHFQTLNLLGAL